MATPSLVGVRVPRRSRAEATRGHRIGPLRSPPRRRRGGPSVLCRPGAEEEPVGQEETHGGGRAGGALLADRVAVVSGVGPGLGRQAALSLAAHGAAVVLTARRQSTLDEVAAEVVAAGGRAVTVSTDITDAEQCERAIAVGTQEFGRVDVLVNNAFRFDAFQSFEEVDLARWKKIVDTNLFGSLTM